MESITGMDGARITFEVHGDGPHKIVLFFRHFPWIEWGYVKAQPEFTFLIVDPRGHGESSHFDDRSLYGLLTGALDVLTSCMDNDRTGPKRPYLPSSSLLRERRCIC